jgi:cystathionine beta-lyase/cystathionine gamma-synthase
MVMRKIDLPSNNHLLNSCHDSGFFLKNSETTQRAFAEEKGHPRRPELYIYSRYRNPTVAATEERIMELEEASWALLAQSGMAAIDIALSIFQKGPATRPWLFFSEIYGGTNSFVDLVLRPRRGIAVERFYAEKGKYDLNRLGKTLEMLKPELLFLEAVSNPMLIVADVLPIIAMAKKLGIIVIVDNTFATPLLWKPLADGADIVIHSVTKYLAGHGNLTAGVLCGNRPDFAKAAIEYRKWVGHMLNPEDAFRLDSFLKTFELRFNRQCESALALADFLSRHKKIASVYYPGLPSHPSYPQAKKLFKGKGYGGVVTFDIQGADNKKKRKNCDIFIKNLETTIPLVPTLGDVDSILIPIEAVWGEKYPHPGMIRLSVGIEPYEKLESAINEALAAF